jgi:hypothetical protein
VPPTKAARQETRSAAVAVAPPSVLRDVQPAAIGAKEPPVAVEPLLVPVGPSKPVTAPIAPAICPYLGLVDDPDTTFMFAASGHRCRADTTPVKISLPHQGSYCLSGEYQTCPRFPATQAKDVPQLQTTGSHPAPRGVVRGRLLARSIISVVLAILLAVAAIWVIGTSGASPPIAPGSSPADSPRPAPSDSRRAPAAYW